MPGKERVEILYGPEGQIVVETFGVKGTACKEKSKFLEDALGKTVDVKKKIEWHLQNAGNIQKSKRFVGNPSNLCG